MKLLDEKFIVNDQVVIVEARVETLVKESQGFFLNGPMLVETIEKII